MINEKDFELVIRLKRKDQKAYTEFVELYKNLVVNVCNNLLNNTEDAEDVAQEVFVDACTKIVHFREESKLSTWLYRIAINHTLNFIRNNRNKKLKTIKSEVAGDYHMSKSPYEILVNKENYRVLCKAIERLPDKQKIALTLSKIEGLQNKEIAEIMQTSLSSVEVSIHRAKLRIREMLIDYYKN